MDIWWCHWDGCADSADNVNDLIQHIQDRHIDTQHTNFKCQWHDCQRKGENQYSLLTLRIHVSNHAHEHTRGMPRPLTPDHSAPAPLLQCNWEGCAGGGHNLDDLMEHIENRHINAQNTNFKCQWNNCQRKGENQHNIFALRLHMGIHANERGLTRPLTLAPPAPTPSGPAPILWCNWVRCRRSMANPNDLMEHIHDWHINTQHTNFKCLWNNCRIKGEDLYNVSALRFHMEDHAHTPRHMEIPRPPAPAFPAPAPIMWCNWDKCRRSIANPNTNNLMWHIQDRHISIQLTNFKCRWNGCQRKGEILYDISALRFHMEDHVRAALGRIGLLSPPGPALDSFAPAPVPPAPVPPALVPSAPVPPALVPSAPVPPAPVPPALVPSAPVPPAPVPPAPVPPAPVRPQQTSPYVPIPPAIRGRDPVPVAPSLPTVPAVPPPAPRAPASHMCRWHGCPTYEFHSPYELFAHIEDEHIEACIRRRHFACDWLGCPRRAQRFFVLTELHSHMTFHADHSRRRGRGGPNGRWEVDDPSVEVPPRV